MHKKHSLRALNIKITILHIVMKVALFYTQNRSERSTFLHDGDDFFFVIFYKSFWTKFLNLHGYAKNIHLFAFTD
jgi:hypothetical protein